MVSKEKFWEVSKEKKNSQYKFPEGISFLLFGIVGGLTFIFAYTQNLSPLLLGMFLLFHILFAMRTNYNTFHPSALLHFYHGLTGIGLFSMVFVTIGYYFTWILNGGSIEAQRSAELCVIFIYYMLIWVLFASITIIGVYFSVSTIVLWFPYFVQNNDGYEAPFILYIIVVLMGIFALGGWFTHLNFLCSSIFQKEHYGDLTESYHATSKWVAVVSVICGIVFIFIERIIFAGILEELSLNL
jgi:hypothetical protein